MIIRHPDKIRIGNRVFIDDYSFLDARGAGQEGVVIDDDVIIGRGSYIQAKVGPIHIGRGTEVGSGSVVVSQGGVDIGEEVSIGGGCEISGGMFRIPPNESAQYERYSNGPVRIGKRCLLAMGVIVLDNVTVGEGTMVGAGAVVSTSVPPNSIISHRPPMLFRNPKLDESALTSEGAE